MKVKFIQIAAAGAGGTYPVRYIFALDNKGRVWHYSDSHWVLYEAPDDPDDDGIGGDDAADALRYLAFNRPVKIIATRLRGL